MYQKPTDDKLELVKKIRADWQSGLYTARQLHAKYGIRVDSIIYNKSYHDPEYKPRVRGTTRPRG